MSDGTLLLGVRPHPHGKGFEVRVQINGVKISESYRTANEANARKLELEKLREGGFAVARGAGASGQTVRQAGEALLLRKSTLVSRKTKRKLREGGIEWWRRITKPWVQGDYADLPLSLLHRADVEDLIMLRASEHPKAANDELYGLKAILRYAGTRGGQYDHGILEIEPIAQIRRVRRSLDVAELEFLASHAPDYAERLLLFLGTAGLRIKEAFTLTDDRIDLRAGEVFIPAALCKEGVDKIIDLTGEEKMLLREQLIARAPGTNVVFPSKTGKRWLYPRFHHAVWHKAVRRAARAWRAEHRLGEWDSTPFEWQLLDDRGVPRISDDGSPVLDRLEPHDLRATAATLMRDAGYTRDQAAARLGHADSGELLDRLYDVGDRRKRAGVRDAIEQLTPDGLRAALRR